MIIDAYSHLLIDEVPPLMMRPRNPYLDKRGSDMGYARETQANEFTNEEHNGLDAIVDHNGKKIFGVLGSGDHLINSIALGCDEYVGVDLSVFSLLLSELKLAALKNFDYDTFRTFFGVTCDPGSEMVSSFLADIGIEPTPGLEKESTAFDHELYSSIKDDLSPVAKNFFGIIIGIQDSQSFETYLCDPRLDRDEMTAIPYLRSEAAYNQAKEALVSGKTKITFHLGDVLDVLSRAETTFDIIYLSNLLEYKIAFADDQEAALNTITPTLISKLNTGGVVIDYSMMGDILMERMSEEGYKTKTHNFSQTSKKTTLTNAHLIYK